MKERLFACNPADGAVRPASGCAAYMLPAPSRAARGTAEARREITAAIDDRLRPLQAGPAGETAYERLLFLTKDARVRTAEQGRKARVARDLAELLEIADQVDALAGRLAGAADLGELRGVLAEARKRLTAPAERVSSG